MTTQQIAELEKQIFDLTAKLNELRKENHEGEVPNYTFDTLAGETTLLEMFGDRDKLLVIHNMGQGCRYCTLWADGFNGILPHLEDALSIVFVSKDPPEMQRKFANARNWRFRMASHGNGPYNDEQLLMENTPGMPDAVVYERDGSTIRRKNACVFGPGDIYCSVWGLLGLAGMGEAEWTPQFSYWRRPEKLDDGGQNILE